MKSNQTTPAIACSIDPLTGEPGYTVDDIEHWRSYFFVGMYQLFRNQFEFLSQYDAPESLWVDENMEPVYVTVNPYHNAIRTCMMSIFDILTVEDWIAFAKAIMLNEHVIELAGPSCIQTLWDTRFLKDTMEASEELPELEVSL